jgi:hypothetical protein
MMMMMMMMTMIKQVLENEVNTKVTVCPNGTALIPVRIVDFEHYYLISSIRISSSVLSVPGHTLGSKYTTVNSHE